MLDAWRGDDGVRGELGVDVQGDSGLGVPTGDDPGPMRADDRRGLSTPEGTDVEIDAERWMKETRMYLPAVTVSLWAFPLALVCE